MIVTEKDAGTKLCWKTLDGSRVSNERAYMPDAQCCWGSRCMAWVPVAVWKGDDGRGFVARTQKQIDEALEKEKAGEWERLGHCGHIPHSEWHDK